MNGQGIEGDEQGQSDLQQQKTYSLMVAANQPLPLSNTPATQPADELEPPLMVPGRRANRYLACPTCQPGGRPFRLYDPLLFNHGDPNDSGRHIGKGQPLEGTSWLNRPVHGGWFIGGMIGDELINGRVDQGENVFGGYRFGWDFDHYWGYELRLGFVNLPVLDSRFPPIPRDSSNLLVDLNLLHYPFGDARWRPYASLGFGAASFSFRDDRRVHHGIMLLQMPIGIGIKYQWKKWLALRFDAIDNIAFGGSGLETMNNFSISAGLEVHNGSRPRSYYPWSTSTHLR